MGAGPHHPEFEAQSTAYKFGAYFRQSIQEFALFICGVGLLYRKSWARRGALVVLVVSTIYAGRDFAWGFAKGPPSITVMLISYALMILWNSIWFVLIYKGSSKHAMI